MLPKQQAVLKHVLLCSGLRKQQAMHDQAHIGDQSRHALPRDVGEINQPSAADVMCCGSLALGWQQR